MLWLYREYKGKMREENCSREEKKTKYGSGKDKLRVARR